MDSMNAINWRTSSKSGGNGGECVEVADAPAAAGVPGRVLVRDSKNRGTGGPVLGFTPAAWTRFTSTLK